jgi:hypothetical protein
MRVFFGIIAATTVLLSCLFAEQTIQAIALEKATSTSAIITYQTTSPSLTYAVYGTNFDFVYENKLDAVYMNPNPTTNHRVVVGGLIPNVTYAYFVLAKDDKNQDVRSPLGYFSTVEKNKK